MSAVDSVWYDIVPELLAQLEAERVGFQEVRIWSLVLSSQYIIHRAMGQSGSHAILVPSGDAEEAIRQIVSFEQENADWQTDWVPPAEVGSPIPSISVMLVLGIFHGLVTAGLWVSRAVWMHEGSAQAGLIMNGELWRTVTALTLHANMLHVVSNMIFGGFFVVWLCRELGTGLGWISTLAAGTVGNLVNALVQSGDHNSIGASTAVFGAIGLISALRMQPSEDGSKGVLIPLMTGIILMALLGTGGERTDVGAHLFGLLAGLAIGAGISVALNRGYFPTQRVQQRLGIAAASIPAVAWIVAFAF